MHYNMLDMDNIDRFLHRQLFRMQIEQSANGGMHSLRELVAKVREKRKHDDYRPDKVVNVLSTTLLPFKTEYYPIANYLFEQLQLSRYAGRVDSIVIGGSLVHGGSRIRTITNEAKSEGHDFDLALFLKSPESRILIGEVSSLLKQCLAEWLRNNPEFVAAHRINEREFSICDGMMSFSDSIPSFREIETKIYAWQAGTAPYDERYAIASRLFMLLEPCAPLEKNHLHLITFFRILNFTYHFDQRVWRELLDVLIREYQSHHRLKLKHFGTAARLSASLDPLDAWIMQFNRRQLGQFQLFLQQTTDSTLPDLAQLYPSEFLEMIASISLHD